METNGALLRGKVIKLDRSFPLVQLENGEEVRCKHATDLVKLGEQRAVIGDVVGVDLAGKNDKALIVSIEPRSTQLIRKDPAERTQAQILAANFNVVLVAQPLCEVNLRRLEREMVLAHETGAQVSVVLTKADLVTSKEAAAQTLAEVRAHIDARVQLYVVSENDTSSITALRDTIQKDTFAIVIGRSGVGKSSLINALAQQSVLKVGDVRNADGKGRHTTVSREIVFLANGGCIADMPGVRGLGMWEAEAGIAAAFDDIEQLAHSCRFDDCRHVNEPGCAVRSAVEAGRLSPERLASYIELTCENATMRKRKEQASWTHRKNASSRKFRAKRS